MNEARNITTMYKNNENLHLQVCMCGRARVRKRTRARPCVAVCADSLNHIFYDILQSFRHK